MRVWAVIAAYDEERAVGQVVAGIRPHVEQVVVVDDGSHDRTAAVAGAAGAIVVRHPVNRGKGCAVRSGLARALAAPCSHVLLADADLQHDPRDVPRLLERARAGRGDFVLGERQFQRHAMPAARYWSNRVGNRILSAMIGVRVADSQSGFRLIRADLLRRLTLDAERYEIETEITVKLARMGARPDTVPIHPAYDGAPSKLRPVRDTVRTCIRALRYRFLEK